MAKRKRRGAQVGNPDPPDDEEIQGADATAQKAWKNWRASRTHLSKWKQEARESYDFVAGVQWNQEDVDKLTNEQRQPITFNRTATTVDAVSGYEINGRQDVTFIPRTTEDNGPAEVESNAARYFRQECDAEDEESDSFYDMLTCGMGWVEHRMDYETAPEGMLAVERVDPLEMGYDPTAKKRNLVDRRWDIRGMWMDKTKAEEKWPDHDWGSPNELSDGDADFEENEPVNVPENAFYRTGSGEPYDRKRGKVFILELTWFEIEPYYEIVDPQTGARVKLDADKHAKLKKLHEQMSAAAPPEQPLPPFKSAKLSKRAFKRAFVHGAKTLEEGPGPCPDMFHYQPMTGKRDRNRNYWFGIVRAMKDPQMWANKWMTQQLHIINSNVKGGIDYEEGAFEDVTDVEKNAAKPGRMLKINTGFFEKVRRVDPAQMPNNVFELMQFAIVSLRDVTGVNVETLGTADRNQPGVLEHQRKQSAMTILAPLFDSLRRYRKAAGRLTLYFIQAYLSDGRLIRIVGDDDAEYVPLTKKEGFVEYDVIVDQAPTAPNQKEAAFASIIQIIPALQKMGIPIPPEVLDYVPGLPAKLTQVWKKMLTKGPNPEEMIRKLLEGLQALAEIEKTGTESERNRAAALKDTMGIQLNTADVITNLMSTVGQLQQGDQQMQQDHQIAQGQLAQGQQQLDQAPVPAGPPAAQPESAPASPFGAHFVPPSVN
jgi:hypothetical protein